MSGKSEFSFPRLVDDLETIVTGGFLESIETNERVVSNLPQFMVISCHPGSMMTILLRNDLLVYFRMYRGGEFVFLEPVFFLERHILYVKMVIHWILLIMLLQLQRKSFEIILYVSRLWNPSYGKWKIHLNEAISFNPILTLQSSTTEVRNKPRDKLY